MTLKPRILRNDGGNCPKRSAYIDALLEERRLRLARAASMPKVTKVKA